MLNRTIKILMVFALFVGGFVPAFAQQSPELSAAIKLTVDERFDEAADAFAKLIAAQPNNGDAYFYSADNLFKAYFSDTISKSLKEITEQAKEVLEKGLQADNANPLVKVGLGKVALLNKDVAKAQSYFNEVQSKLPPVPENPKKLKKFPEPQRFSIIQQMIADAYYFANRKDSANSLPLLRKAVFVDPKNVDAFLLMGDIYNSCNDGTKSIGNYNKAQDAAPTSPAPKIKIGNIYVRGRNFGAAIDYYRQAEQIDANYAPVFRELGYLYYITGKYDISKQNYKKFLELSNNNISAKIQYANSLYSAGDYNEAINQITEILAVDQSRNYLNRLIAYSYFEIASANKDNVAAAEQNKKALEYMEKFLSKAKEENKILKDYSYYGRILIKASQDSIGQMQLEKAYTMDTTNAALLNEIALNYYKYKRYAKAIDAFKRKLKKDPVNINLQDYMFIGKSYYSIKDYSNADTLFTKVIKFKPDFVQAYEWLGNSASAADPDFKGEVAKQRFEKLIEVASVDAQKNLNSLLNAYNFLGFYCIKREDWCGTKNYYSKMLELDPNNAKAKKVLEDPKIKKTVCK